MTPTGAVLLALALASASPAFAQADRGEPKPRRMAKPTAPARSFEPYDPDRARAGRTPGFIDLGNGTEVRVGGRVRMDYDLRR